MSSQPNSTLPVLIVGAGPAGLVLALTLLKNGITFRIIDKAAAFHKTQRGAGLQPRSLETFSFLGVLPEIQKNGVPFYPIRVYKLPGGTEILKTWEMDPHKDPTPSIPWPNLIMHGQHRTESVLRSHLAQQGVHVELSTELRAFEQDSEGVTAHILKTKDGVEVEETVRARWLVGADGARGVVRKQLGLSFLGETRAAVEHTILADLHLTGLDRNHWHVWGDVATELLLIRPTEQNDDSFWLLGGGNIDHAKLVADREEFVKFVHDASNRDDIKIGEIDNITEFRPNIRMVDKFGEGRVFVVGDAAHVHSPSGGQGLNSSIQDSFNLAWKLALVEKSVSPPSILSTYTSERIPVIAQMLQLTTALLDTAFADKTKSPNFSDWNRNQSLNQLGINYRWSDIVVDERSKDHESVINAYGTVEGGSLRAGDRAPDAPALKDANGTTTSLFQIFTPAHHTALLFTDKPSEIGPVVDALAKFPEGAVSSVLVLPKGTTATAIDKVNAVLQDTEGHAHVEYGVTETGVTVVIVRPDGYVGAIVYGAPGIERYRNLLFSKA